MQLAIQNTIKSFFTAPNLKVTPKSNPGKPGKELGSLSNHAPSQVLTTDKNPFSKLLEPMSMSSILLRLNTAKELNRQVYLNLHQGAEDFQKRTISYVNILKVNGPEDSVVFKDLTTSLIHIVPASSIKAVIHL